MYNYSANTNYIGKRFLYLTTCHSTNDLAKSLNTKGLCNDGMVIFTEEQTHGRGQQGATWLSAPRQNLTFTIVLQPQDLTLKSQFFFNKALSIHLLGFLRTYFSTRTATFQIKWPNDIYLNGKKIAGMLVENSLQGTRVVSSIVGIGLNVNQLLFDFPTASSLAATFGEELDRYALLNNLLSYLDENLPLRYDSLSHAESQTLQHVYHSSLLGLNEPRWFKTPSDNPFQATLKGIDEQGQLILETATGRQLFEIKSIQFLNDPVD